MMTTRWQRTAEQSWASPTRVYKISKEQKSQIPAGTDLNWVLEWKTHLQEHQWTLYLIPTQNHKEMICQVKWTPSNTRKVGQRTLKARYQWHLYLDLHSISDPNVCDRTFCLRPDPLKMGTEMPPKRSKPPPPSLFREGINRSLCAPTVKYTQLAWKKRKFSFCYSTDTKGNSLADFG